MDYTTLSQRLNARTGLTFNSLGQYVPFHQLGRTRSFKLKVAYSDLKVLQQASKDLMFEMDTVTQQMNDDKLHAAMYKLKLHYLKEEFKIIYYTVKQYTKIINLI